MWLVPCRDRSYFTLFWAVYTEEFPHDMALLTCFNHTVSKIKTEAVCRFKRLVYFHVCFHGLQSISPFREGHTHIKYAFSSLDS